MVIINSLESAGNSGNLNIMEFVLHELKDKREEYIKNIICSALYHKEENEHLGAIKLLSSRLSSYDDVLNHSFTVGNIPATQFFCDNGISRGFFNYKIYDDILRSACNSKDEKSSCMFAVLAINNGATITDAHIESCISNNLLTALIVILEAFKNNNRNKNDVSFRVKRLYMLYKHSPASRILLNYI